MSGVRLSPLRLWRCGEMENAKVQVSGHVSDQNSNFLQKTFFIENCRFKSYHRHSVMLAANILDKTFNLKPIRHHGKCGTNSNLSKHFWEMIYSVMDNKKTIL